MRDISWQITIGRYELKMLDSFKVTRSVDKLQDTADIVLPASVFNKAIEVESKIKRGDQVTILAGYDGTLVKEFVGWLEAISTDDGSLTLQCEDDIFKFRVPVKDKQLISADVKEILQYVCNEVGGFSLECDYAFKYDSFVIRGATGYDILKKIQEECRANVYIREGVLHLHPQYRQIFGSAKYSFQRNIESSELEYKNARDRAVEVIVEGKDKSGKVIRQMAGTTGGDQVTIKIDGVSDISTLKALADEQLKLKSYTGYSGSFTGWLVPYCEPGYKVSISDKDYEYKDGDYYVTEVVTSLSSAGGSRQVTVGMKI